MSAEPARTQGLAPRGEERLLSDVLLPAQAVCSPSTFLSRTPSSRLAHAILEQAIDDLAHPHRVKAFQQLAYRDAYWWVASSDVTHHFSFLNLCETLGYHADSVRAALLRSAPVPSLGPPRRTLRALRSADRRA